MKVVINKCYGGFSLSMQAVKRLAEMQGRPCYFFGHRDDWGKIDFRTYSPISNETAENSAEGLFWVAFDIPNPNEIIYWKPWAEMSQNERTYSCALYGKHFISNRPNDRSADSLVRVVEELGLMANGVGADLSIVEIPDGVDYEIEEYDGLEHIAEVHRTWR